MILTAIAIFSITAGATASTFALTNAAGNKKTAKKLQEIPEGTPEGEIEAIEMEESTANAIKSIAISSIVGGAVAATTAAVISAISGSDCDVEDEDADIDE